MDFLPMAWFHEKQHDEFDPIGASHGAGGNQRSKEQVLETSFDGLSFTLQAGRRRHVSREQVVGDTRVHLEADLFGLLGNIDQHPVLDGLVPRVTGDDLPVLVHFDILPVGISVNSWNDILGPGDGHEAVGKTELHRRGTYLGPDRGSPAISGPGWTQEVGRETPRRGPLRTE